MTGDERAINVWGGIGGEVWAQCGKCYDTSTDSETLDDLTRWAKEHDCRAANDG